MINTTQPVGFILINKPAGPTSFDCIRRIKKLLKIKTKIGHAGTLDDFASGLLIIGIGREATRLISKLMNLDKTYEVKAKLGELTDSLDLTGTVLETKELPPLTHLDLQQAITALGKKYEQIPPIYSALKHEGKPLYKLARNNLMSDEKLADIAKTKSRMVTIHDLQLLDYQEPFFTISAHVSKGTYVRSLAQDIAQKMGFDATTYELARTKIAVLGLDKALKLDDMQTKEDILNSLISVEMLQELLQNAHSPNIP